MKEHIQKYEPVIGLEIHIQLKTQNKMFSACPVPKNTDAPNTVIDPLTVGHPGTLPTINQQAGRTTL
jgi:aspartyl-tRNA(Asn)/glutamyl-tRNA(Gln) amidotransferase subunit B